MAPLAKVGRKPRRLDIDVCNCVRTLLVWTHPAKQLGEIVASTIYEQMLNTLWVKTNPRAKTEKLLYA